MFDWRNLSWKHLFAVLLILYLLPIWIFAYFPTQDGPSHVYNALVLKEYSDHANYKIRDAWKLNITIFPNWLSHIVLAALLYIFPPMMSEKILLTIAIGMIPISFFYFLNAVHKEKKDRFMYAWLGFPFAYNYLLYMGFYNFTLSISFFFFSFGLWWKHKDNLQIKHLSILYILLLLTYLSHIVSFGLVVLGMSVAAGCIWGGKALVEAWRVRTERIGTITRKFIVSLKPFFRFFLYMVPIYFVLMEYYLQSLKQHQTGNHKGMEWIWDYFREIGPLVYFTRWHINANYFLLIVLGIAIVISVGYRIYRKQWIKQTDVFLIIAILFTYMFIKAPWTYGPGGWINDRIHIYILLMLAPWLVMDMHKFIRYGITIGLIIFSLIHFGRTAYEHGSISPEMAELASGTNLIEPHTTFSIRTADGQKSEALGRVDPVAPFIHTQAFYGVYADDVVHMANYEAHYNYFPVNHNNRDNVSLNYIRADYVVAWYYPETEMFADLKPNYDIIHETEHLKLFKRKTQEPALELWDKTEEGNLIIRFDMQPDNAEAEENYHIVGPKTMYQDGKFGWDTEWNPTDPANKTNWRISPRAAYLGPEGPSPLTRDAVFGKEDAAFRIDLPNGTYRITNIFHTAETATHEVYMLANGKPIIKKLIVPPNSKNVSDLERVFSLLLKVYGIGTKVEKTTTVEVDNGHLVLVIYTPKKRIETAKRHIHWIWNGCIVEQIAAEEQQTAADE